MCVCQNSQNCQQIGGKKFPIVVLVLILKIGLVMYVCVCVCVWLDGFLVMYVFLIR